MRSNPAAAVCLAVVLSLAPAAAAPRPPAAASPAVATGAKSVAIAGDVLKRAGAPLGRELSGKAVARTDPRFADPWSSHPNTR